MNCLCVAQHDGNGLRTLAITLKGVKAYESFALARQLMNRTVYFHKRVKTFEFMMEEFIRRILKNIDLLDQHNRLREVVPKYFRAVAQLLDDPNSWDRAEALDQFLKANLAEYLAMAEDSIWTLLGACSEFEKKGLPSRIQPLADSILRRRAFPSYIVERGKNDILREALERAKLKSNEDYAITALSTVAYKRDREPVFVVAKDPPIQELCEHSDLISQIRDRSESDLLLVAITEKKAAKIQTVAKTASVRLRE